MEVSMRVLSAILLISCVSFLLPNAAAQSKVGRYDEQILQDVNKFLQSKKGGDRRNNTRREGHHRQHRRVAPPSTFDDDLRMKLYRAIYGQASLRRYELDPQNPIRIVVENGKVTLYGVVDNAMDKQIAGVQASSLPGVFSGDNTLVVAS
jgi:hypothetical protein